MIHYMVIAFKPSFPINFSSGAISFQILKYFYYRCGRFLPRVLQSRFVVVNYAEIVLQYCTKDIGNNFGGCN